MADEREIGRIEARLTGVENTLAEVRADAQRLFEATDSIARSQAVMASTMQRQHEDMSQFVQQCRGCRDDIGSMKSEISEVQKEIGTDKIRKKATGDVTAVRQLRPWEKPIGDFMGDIVLGAIKAVGIGSVIAIIIYGVSNANL